MARSNKVVSNITPSKSLIAAIGRVAKLAKQQRNMVVLVGFIQGEHHRDFREEGWLTAFFVIVAGFENDTINTRLSYLTRRIKSWNTPLRVGGSLGQFYPLISLFSIQLDLNACCRYASLQIQYMYTQRIFHFCGKGGGAEQTQRAD